MPTEHLLLLLTMGAVGAAVGRTLHLPMWPLTGAILGAATVHLVGLGSVSTPGWLSLAGQLLVGCAVGSAVGGNLFRTFAQVTAPGALVVAALVGTGLAIGAAISAAGLAERAVAVLGSIPAGVGEMVAVAAGLGADSALVAAMHMVRLFAVLLTVPLLLRWGRRWRREQ